MALIGIDTSSYQATLDLSAIRYDFLMVKATQGINYVNPDCDAQFQKAESEGKKLAVYHYADGNDAVAEANWFVDNCQGYIRRAIFVLDWEGTGVEDVDWAGRFWDQVKSRIGYNPAIYMSEFVVNAYNWQPLVDRGAGLIAAKYSDYEIDNNYDMSGAGTPPNVKWWPFYFMWQWTSKGHLDGYAGDLDCDIFYGDGAAWDAYAGRLAPAPVPAPPAPTTTTTTLAAPEPTTTTTTETPPPAPSTTTTTIYVSVPPVEPVTTPNNWLAVVVAVIVFLLALLFH